MEIFLDHVRSFSKPQYVPLRPLTLLVGENSSGKSTFLASIACAFDQARFPADPGFNEPPYNLGSFETIATAAVGQRAASKTFSIGFRLTQADEFGSNESQAIAKYESRSGQPRLEQFVFSTSKGKLEIDVSGTETVNGRITLLQQNAPARGPFDFSVKLETTGTAGDEKPVSAHRILSAVYTALHDREREWLDRDSAGTTEAATTPGAGDILNFISRFHRGFIPVAFLCKSIGPIRSTPQRTYDHSIPTSDPDGANIPQFLARLYASNSPNEAKESQRLRDSITTFGIESGMFQELAITHLGDGPGSPFQIQIVMHGSSTNLMDVGYGVGQVLPIVIDSELKAQGNILLMQQPEVHLHPRAQAALGSLFARLASTGDRALVVETHSDYLLDRVRQAVANGVIAPDRVAILFFDKPASETTVHLIELDELGNLVDPPQGYRDFFLEEELNLLRRGS